MDAFCFMRSSNKTYKNSPWFHTDQAPLNEELLNKDKEEKNKKKKKNYPDSSPLNPFLRCVQGFINLFPCGPQDGGLTILKYSHRAHQGFFEQHNLLDTKENWFKFSANHMDYLNEIREDGSSYVADVQGPLKMEEIKICVEPGDMVFWDSRTHHEAKWPETVSQKRYIQRGVVYSCMSPEEWQDDVAKRNRTKALALLQTTSHWPHYPKIFPDRNRYTNGRVGHIKTIPNLSPLGREIAGLDPNSNDWPLVAIDHKKQEITLAQMTKKREAKDESSRATKKRQKEQAARDDDDSSSSSSSKSNKKPKNEDDASYKTWLKDFIILFDDE
jgi:hypothetical protein